MRRFAFCLGLALLLANQLWAAPQEVPPDYFPVPVGATWEYRTTTSMSTPIDMTRKVVDATRQPDGTYLIRVDAMTPEVTSLDYTKGNGWVLLHKTEMTSNGYQVEYTGPKKELMNPLQVGQTWEYTGKGGGYDIKETSKVVRSEQVKVPAGEFQAMVVETHADQGGNVYDMTQWYVNHLGAVKITTKGSSFETTTELLKYSFPK